MRLIDADKWIDDLNKIVSDENMPKAAKTWAVGMITEIKNQMSEQTKEYKYYAAVLKAELGNEAQKQLSEQVKELRKYANPDLYAKGTVYPSVIRLLSQAADTIEALSKTGYGKYGAVEVDFVQKKSTDEAAGCCPRITM